MRLYLGYTGAGLSNLSIIHEEMLDTDGLWCQSASNATAIGAWYAPNGPLYLQVGYEVGQVGLLPGSNRHRISGYEGLYHCVIPDDDGINQTLFVAIYTKSEYYKGK